MESAKKEKEKVEEKKSRVKASGAVVAIGPAGKEGKALFSQKKRLANGRHG